MLRRVNRVLSHLPPQRRCAYEVAVYFHAGAGWGGSDQNGFGIKRLPDQTRGCGKIEGHEMGVMTERCERLRRVQIPLKLCTSFPVRRIPQSSKRQVLLSAVTHIRARLIVSPVLLMAVAISRSLRP